MIENVVYCEMGRSQRQLYESILGAFRVMLKNGTAAKVNSIALEALLRLRQCCSHPQLLPTSLNPHAVFDSIKLNIAFEIIDRDILNGRNVIVFSQFRMILDEIENALKSRGIRSIRIDGNTLDRRIPVDQFQNDPSVWVIAIGFRSGGFGINLTAAESVVLFDPWWNPAAESQAFARAHRIWQRKTVLVSKLICNNSVEEKMLQLVATKCALADSLSDLSAQLNATEMIELIGS